MDRYYEQAFSLMTSSESRRVFDLSREPDALRDRYGRTRFGQSCLLARRLVESGVPFVQVNWSTHVEAEEDAGDGGSDEKLHDGEYLRLGGRSRDGTPRAGGLGRRASLASVAWPSSLGVSCSHVPV